VHELLKKLFVDSMTRKMGGLKAELFQMSIVNMLEAQHKKSLVIKEKAMAHSFKTLNLEERKIF